MGNSKSTSTAGNAGEGSSCPVGFGRAAAPESRRSCEDAQGGGCPVDHKNMTTEEIKKKMYDVYGQEIDPRNMMPTSHGTELPSPSQQSPLSLKREESTIPKSGSDGDEHWVYPSPQQFFNALKRKGKGDDVAEADMDMVVHIHNRMNERTWQEVLHWERLHCSECEDVRLSRFQGKPQQLSPTARLHVLSGGEAPFDRHDWIVDRCGKEVRYVIDYYSKPEEKRRDENDSVHLHVRPALDSMENAVDRFRMRFWPPKDASVRSASVGAVAANSPAADPRTIVPRETLDAEEFNFLASLTGERIRKLSQRVGERCGAAAEQLQKCQGEACERASVAANYCAGCELCPRQAEAFMSAVSSGDSVGAHYDKMTKCLDRFHLMALRVTAQEKGLKHLGPELIPSSARQNEGGGAAAAAAAAAASAVGGGGREPAPSST